LINTIREEDRIHTHNRSLHLSAPGKPLHSVEHADQTQLL
jgi:hypothetical protein